MIEYDAHNWRDHLFDIKGSMVRDIGYRVLACVIVAVGVTWVHHHHVHLGVPEKGHALIGIALGLLLVFRTNASYDRFWEGRKQWGAIVNETRNLVRGAVVLLARDPELLGRLVRWTQAFPYAVMHKLRDARGLGPPGEALPPAEARQALEAEHVPLWCARRMTAALAEARDKGLVSDYLFASLDQNVQQLVDYMGACERIHRTPLPFAYVVHLRRALLLYCLTLPFALLDTFGWWTVVVTLLISYTLLGIEEIGVEIEDPFGIDDNDLPLEQICATIERNLGALLEAPARLDRAA